MTDGRASLCFSDRCDAYHLALISQQIHDAETAWETSRMNGWYMLKPS